MAAQTGHFPAGLPYKWPYNLLCSLPLNLLYNLPPPTRPGRQTADQAGWSRGTGRADYFPVTLPAGRTGSRTRPRSRPASCPGPHPASRPRSRPGSRRCRPGFQRIPSSAPRFQTIRRADYFTGPLLALRLPVADRLWEHRLVLAPARQFTASRVRDTRALGRAAAGGRGGEEELRPRRDDRAMTDRRRTHRRAVPHARHRSAGAARPARRRTPASVPAAAEPKPERPAAGRRALSPRRSGPGCVSRLHSCATTSYRVWVRAPEHVRPVDGVGSTKSPPSLFHRRRRRRWSARSSGSAGLRAGCWRTRARGGARPGACCTRRTARKPRRARRCSIWSTR
ncbi:hypothetical protein SHL15_0096 [Streptomyces hygroscopicus subsp. limoneus]|nr:hypothetical protein SHL15_0096 [Streptomyces hygroscopicus subsp. limoneus]